jgi:two-component system NtrC family sensor kinase
MQSLVKMGAFQDIRTQLHSSLQVSEVLRMISKKATEAVNAKGALVRILNLETNEFELEEAYGLGEKYLSHRLLDDPKSITELYRLNDIVVIDDILHNPRVKHPEEAYEEGFRMMVDVPLSLKKRIVGIIRVCLTEHREITRDELNLLVACATCGACAFDNARHMEAQQSQYESLTLQTEKLSALGRMAAGIAHGINNPLAGILLYSTNLLRKTPENSPLHEGLDIIVYETKRCGNIIQGLLEFSRGGEPNKALAHINDIIEKALLILENEFLLHHIEVKKQLSPTMPKILVDINQMEQVFVNLLLNAIEAIQNHGVVTFKSYLGDDQSSEVIEVSDTGCGIAPENISRIFEPFYSNKKHGTGLGLSVSYGIVRKHGGSIKVFSRQRTGTRFIIELPLSAMHVVKEQ